ncbi:MAG: LysR family transcriptional regulator [Planctomycetaceae bacterium]|nr:LysR family transcriptional regulator [Planctomycetaceae bacterium]
MALRSIELFCDIVAHHSFSKAAEAWGLSQPAVSQALQQLEERLGIELIDRSKRPFELTAAGRFYYERCSRLLDEFHAVEDDVQSLGGKVAGRVRVVSIYSVGLLQMKKYVALYQAAYPEVDLHLDYAHPDEVYARVVREEADLGIVSFPKDGGEVSCVEWQRQEMVAVTASGHPLATQPSLKLRDLDGQDFVAFTPDLTIRRITDKLFKRHKVAVNIVHQFDNIENVKRAVEIGLGVSLLPLDTLRRELEFQTLRAILLKDVTFERPLGIVHKRHKHLSTAAEKFIELLQADVDARDERNEARSPAAADQREPVLAGTRR